MPTATAGASPACRGWWRQIKDVTYEMLTDKEFGGKVLAQIPRSVVQGALRAEDEVVKAATESQL